MGNDDPNFFRDWMDEKRLSAASVCGPLQVSEQTIHQWRSYGVPPRRVPHVRKFMEEWVDPSDKAAGGPLSAIVISLPQEQFDRWNMAANSSPGGPLLLTDWINRTLEEAAKEFEKSGKLPGEGDEEADVLPFRAVAEEGASRFSSRLTDEPAAWADLRGGIAAGAPISSHVVAEPIPVGKVYPSGHYALRVFGASMEPKVPDGSTIIVKEWPSNNGLPKKGTIVVYSDASGSTLKEFGYRKAQPGEEDDADTMGNIKVLRSLNKAFPEVQTMEGGRIDAVFVEVV